MDYKKEYVDFLKKFMDIQRPLTVVFDASNGPTGMLLNDLWKGGNVRAIIINDTIDPDFSVHGPNPLVQGASEQCAQAIRTHNADLGVMFDADGDRAIFVDDQGTVLPAYLMAALMFKAAPPPYVADELTYQSLRMMNVFPEKDLLPSRVGAIFVKEQMRENGASVGSEYSGHYFFRDFFNADSGLFAAIMVLNTLSKMNVPISEWKSQFGQHAVVTKEIRTEGKNIEGLHELIERTYITTSQKMDRLDGITFIFDLHWINIRSSNTEPLLRIISGGSEMEDRMREMEEVIISFLNREV